MDITNALRTIGLNDKEARVYTALLSLGQSTAYVIADRAGIKKPTTYVILEQLIEKGVARRTPRSKKARYSAISPDELFLIAEERMALAKETIPQLLALSQKEASKSKTLFFEGLTAVRQAFFDQARKMEGKELVGFYAHAEDVPKEIFPLVEEYNEELKHRNVRLRGIAPNHPSLKSFRKTDKKYGRTMKVVPMESYSSPISVDIGEGHTLFFEPKSAQATLIESAAIAKTMREIFDIVWEKTEK